MKRRAARVVVFLLLLAVGGAIVNVVVAWGCALTFRSLVEDRTKLSMQELNWPHEYLLRARWPGPHDIESLCERPGYRRMHYESVVTELTSVYLDVQEYGWPLRTMVLHSMYGVGFELDDGTDTLIDADPLLDNAREFSGHWKGIELPWFSNQPIQLPTAVHPLRFAINTMFYAGVLWMMFAMPFVVRRRRRIKRGLCPACAYPVGSSPVCTECGKAVKQSAASGQKSADVQT